ncbi:MAG TPA: cellulase-like family protein [Ktedonobacteraceae bacterium]|nr:cellulase-like family protein [Ktedonobacteraceae bacterium]
MTHVHIPDHLPQKLTISLWDFSWYTMTMPGEPFEDLDRAFAEAVERGYNTVRICAMPYLLFGDHQIDTSQLHFSHLGGDFGQRTRWYNTKGGAVLNGREHLLHLFQAAKRHGCFIILSSWEYQQSPSFLKTPDWYNALVAIPPQQRFLTMARAMCNLITFVKDHQLGDRIAYAELHNEVDWSKLNEVGQPGENPMAAEKPYLEEAVTFMRAQHPDILMTVCYTRPPVTHMRYLAENLQLAHFHVYIYGVLDALMRELGFRYDELARPEQFPGQLARELLRADAPPFDSWLPDEEWRLQATGIDRRLFYIHDWTDPDAWDNWLYEHYGNHRLAMFQTLRNALESTADWAEQHGIPAVIGEGYVGYTPLLANFEEGPVGKHIIEYAVDTCLRLNYWGIILCSNAAPHHPFWKDVAWQKRMNTKILQ